MAAVADPVPSACPACGGMLDTAGHCSTCPPAGEGEGTLTEPPLPPAPTYGDFEVVRHADGGLWELGRGAMGITYHARDRVLERPVALKVIRDAGGPVRERFLREARAAAALRHPNVADIFQFGVSERTGTCYYAMELVEGETVEARVRREGPLAAAVALDIAAQVAAALVAAARSGLIHRDLKPSNLLLTAANGEVKVVDFGLAKAVTPTAGKADLTHGGFVGTPAYASPEQFGRGLVDERSDFYSLGVTLWFMLTGHAPFTGRTLEEWRTHPARIDLPFAELAARRVPAPVVGVLRRVLAIDPEQRPASARELLEEINECRRALGFDPARPGDGDGKSRVSRTARAALLSFLASLVVVGAGLGLWWRPGRGGVGVTEPPPATLERSIAVLPFKNLGDAENGYFAEGVQDEILTDLARIADLKVISQTSVMAYVPTHSGNVREIAQALGVSHLLEGSVQRVSGRVRVTAKLIDARNDREVWAERYDNDLADIFRIQSEIAQAIAGNLRAKLSTAERAAIDVRPTDDLVAWDLYLRAKEMVVTFAQTPDWRGTLLAALRLLDEAVTRDRKFALAYCLTATAHSDLYYTGLDHTPARLSLQEAATVEALRLQPDLGEAHLARALWYYRGQRNYTETRRELSIARTALPNSAAALLLLAYVERREGHWSAARETQERAAQLDPTNYDVVTELLVLYDYLRLYRDFVRVADTAIARLPAYGDYLRLLKAQILLEAGDTRTARAVLTTVPADYDPNGGATYARVTTALYDGQVREADALVEAFHGDAFPANNGEMTPRAWLEIYIARAEGNEAHLHDALERARSLSAAEVAQHPDNANALALLGLADAGLGHREDALREGHRAVEMRPLTVDAMDAPSLLTDLAQIELLVGDSDAAVAQLTMLEDVPGGPITVSSAIAQRGRPCMGAATFKLLSPS